VRVYADLSPMGGELIPLRSACEITWRVTSRDGAQRRFEYPTRMVEGEITDSFLKIPQPSPQHLRGWELCGTEINRQRPQRSKYAAHG